MKDISLVTQAKEPNTADNYKHIILVGGFKFRVHNDFYDEILGQFDSVFTTASLLGYEVKLHYKDYNYSTYIIDTGILKSNIIINLYKSNRGILKRIKISVSDEEIYKSNHTSNKSHLKALKILRTLI